MGSTLEAQAVVADRLGRQGLERVAKLEGEPAVTCRRLRIARRCCRVRMMMTCTRNC